MLKAVGRALAAVAKRNACESNLDRIQTQIPAIYSSLQERLISTSSDDSHQSNHRHFDLSQKSHVLGAPYPPLLTDTISSNLRRTVEKYPTNPAIISVSQKKTLTYREFLTTVEDVASALLSLGVQKKNRDRVALWAANCLEWTVIQYATAMIGAIQVSLNPALKEAELAHALHRSGTSVMILAPEFKGESQIDVLKRVQRDNNISSLLKHTILLDTDGINKENQHYYYDGSDIPSNWLRWSDFLNNKNNSSSSKALLYEREHSLHPEDAVNMQFTSGTTGLPKAATLTHRNVINNGYLIGHLLSYSSKDKVCIPVPLFHCFGQVLGNLACTTHGATMVYPGPVFDPSAVLRSVESEKCTSLYGVPSQFIAELENPDFDTYDLSSLRTGIMAGAPCPIHIMRSVREKMLMKEISICFGQTETSPVSFQTRKDDSEEQRVCTVGTVHPHTEACVVDPETHEIVERGVSGELWIRGYSVMQGYWNDTEATNSTIDAQGWCHTGDLAVLDDQGYCKVVGRIKDMVLRGGECLFPKEIEDFLHHNPVISDVQVFGVPDERMGEQLCAWVKLVSNSSNTNSSNNSKGGGNEDKAAAVASNNSKGGEIEDKAAAVAVSETDLRNWCLGRVSKHKIPKYWKIVSSFPTTASGKPQKYLMRRQAIEELGLAGVAEAGDKESKERAECPPVQASH